MHPFIRPLESCTRIITSITDDNNNISGFKLTNDNYESNTNTLEQNQFQFAYNISDINSICNGSDTILPLQTKTEHPTDINTNAIVNDNDYTYGTVQILTT